MKSEDSKNSAQEKIEQTEFYEQIEHEIEKRTEERVKKAKKMQYAANPLELGQWTCDPEAKDDFPDITKDLFLGNLDKTEFKKLVQGEELIGLLMDNNVILGDVIPLFIRDREVILAASNSKQGFARRQLSEDNVNIRKSLHEQTESSKGIFGGFKRRS